LFGKRELMFAHRGVQIVDAIPFGKNPPETEVAWHEAQAKQREERYEEPARELQRRSETVRDVRGEGDTRHRPDADEREPCRQFLLALTQPDAQRRGNLLRVLECEIDRLGEALGVAVAPDRLLVQAALDRRGEARGHAGRDARDRWRGGSKMLAHDVGARLAIEGEAGGERVVADDDARRTAQA